MIYIEIYLAITFALILVFTLLPTREESRFLCRAIVLWPFSITVIAIVLAWSSLGYDIDVQTSTKWFGSRKPKNPNVRGIAVTVFKREVHIWKKR